MDKTDKVIMKGGQCKSLLDTKMSLHGGRNRIANWVTNDKAGLLGANELATLEAVGEAIQDGIDYVEHVEKLTAEFVANYGNELK